MEHWYKIVKKSNEELYEGNIRGDFRSLKKVRRILWPCWIGPVKKEEGEVK